MSSAPSSPDPNLPILARRSEIEAALRAHPVVVICGETGSGKTTQLPQIVLAMMDARSEGPRGAPKLIGHTQPRRLAARSVAARIAEELGESLGGTVGVKVRFNDQTTPRTRIKVMTDGILLAELASDPDLRAYSSLIIDEAHERSLNIDFLLGYLRELIPRRPDLRIVITSATIEPKRFSAYFNGAPIIEVSGRTYPIDIRYRGDDRSDEPDFIDYEAIADAVEELTSPRTGGPGDILVFLPGEREIRLARDAVTRRRLDLITLPLFSRLSDQEQDAIFHPAPSGKRRVVLATNVAETSLTVPGIRHVIDTGVARISRYDAGKKVQRLPVEPVSRASADQRAGRCGRLGPGICIRLFADASYRARPAFTEPEIRRTNLASVILHMKSLGTRLAPIERFHFLDAPDAAAIRDGYETLFELGAIEAQDTETKDWSESALTPIGRHLARIPVDPRIARMLIAAQREGTQPETLILAAALSIQDPRERPMGKQEDADRAQAVFRHADSDFLVLLNIWDQYTHASDALTRGELVAWCRDRFISPARMREWAETHRQLRAITRDLGDVDAVSQADVSDLDDDASERRGDAVGSPTNPRRAQEDALHRTLLTGLISNVACREGASGSFEYRGVRDNVVHLFPGSVLFKRGPKWIMAAEVVHTTRLYARTVARIEPEWIEELAGHMFRVQRGERHLDPATGRACAWERVTMSSIVVVPRREAPISATEPAAAREIFIREALAKARWETDALFMTHNRAVLKSVAEVEGRLRRHDVMIPDAELAAWFEQRVPTPINSPESFEAWRAEAERRDPHLLELSLSDVVRPESAHGLDRSLYPPSITLESEGRTVETSLEYALAPGKDDDGLTVHVPWLALPDVTEDRLAWLVPGFVPALTLALLKTLPKPVRGNIEQKGDLAEIATACAEVMEFGHGSPEQALAESLRVLFDVAIEATDFQRRALPPHLRPRIRVVDDAGTSLGVDRDLSALTKRFAARIQKERAARRPEHAEQQSLTDWTFGDLSAPAHVTTADAPAPSPAALEFPALIDAGTAVSIVRLPSAEEAAAHTIFGVRRLFALRCAEELSYSIEALPTWRDMTTHYAALGNAAELRDALTLLTVGRAFLDGQSLPGNRDEFEARLASGSARLHLLVREVGESIAPMLEHRHRVAHRLSGGTSKLWAESVADIREQAAYLMPKRFLLVLPWERVRRYAKYTRSMRERLLSLRDEGLKASLEVLRAYQPHWKRFTGHVATRLSEARAASEEALVDQPTPASSPRDARTKAPLPAARRAAPSVNLDAGEWAMQPGRLSGPMETYRWALEDLRVALFTPDLADAGAPTIKQVEAMWQALAADASDAAASKGKPRRK